MSHSLLHRSRWIALGALAALALGAPTAGAVPYTLSIPDVTGYRLQFQVQTPYGNTLIGNYHAIEFDAVLDGVAGIAYAAGHQLQYVLGSSDVYSVLDPSDTLNGDVAAWLVETYRPDRDAPDARERITALQLALFEVTNDSEEWDLLGGSFSVLWVKGTGVELAQSWLDSIPERFETSGAAVVLHHSNYQDQIFIPNVPEPGTLLLLGVGCAGIAFHGRRQRR